MIFNALSLVNSEPESQVLARPEPETQIPVRPKTLKIRARTSSGLIMQTLLVRIVRAGTSNFLALLVKVRVSTSSSITELSRALWTTY